MRYFSFRLSSVMCGAFLLGGVVSPLAAPALHNLELTPLGTYAPGIFDEAAAEIVAHDPATQRLFVVNALDAVIEVLNISDPTQSVKIGEISSKPFGNVANSVAIHGGIIAVAVESDPKSDPGTVVFFDQNFQLISSVKVGAQPDMLRFTPNGRYVLTANEGEPLDYITPGHDPEGSVSIIDVSGDLANLGQAQVRTAGFTGFNGLALPSSIRIFGPNATVAQDLEPEYIAVSHDSKTAWVTLQENNALGVIDIGSATVTHLIGLGFKDHSLPGNGFDASDRDNAINIANWPVQGMYLPDGIAAYESRGQTYLLLADEGDARTDWPPFNEEIRVNDANYKLDPIRFPNGPFLKNNARLGRLRASTATGDLDGDGDFDVIHSFGGRSFSIRDAFGNLVFNSGDQLERLIAAVNPLFFNSNHAENTFDSRSTSKGPEPEGVAVGRAFGRVYAFVVLERVGGIVTYDVTDPWAARLVDYINPRDFTRDPATQTVLAGDLGPEGVIFITAEESPNGRPLLVTANEVSGSTTIFEIRKVD